MSNISLINKLVILSYSWKTRWGEDVNTDNTKMNVQTEADEEPFIQNK